MKQSTENKVKGTFHEVKGKVKEKFGKGDEQSRFGSRRPGGKDRGEDPKENRSSGEGPRRIALGMPLFNPGLFFDLN
jgi:hypothetical protein